MSREYTKVSVTEKAERALKGGHPWVFADEVTAVSGEYENGDIVDVYSKKARYLGSGYINDNSKIRVRVISKNPNDRFDELFYERRVRYAIEYRLTVMGGDFDNCRLIFGEADLFPGLTVDRFGNVLVMQVMSLGCERIKPTIVKALLKVLGEYGVRIDAVYERNDVALRELEGMKMYTDYYCRAEGFDDGGKLIMCENGVKYEVDYINGQKTGFFLDQKYNRQAVARLARGKRVLDCFTHTGSFALNAALAGAQHVCAVDISEDALALAKHNAALNGLEDRMDFVCADVFDHLTELYNGKARDFDMIILDPPAFTKSSSTVASAERGYKEINMKAMKLLPRGGYLATCSCSHFMKEGMFCRMLHDAAQDAAVTLRQIEARKQSPDHPILWNVPETEYLKFYIFQVV